MIRVYQSETGSVLRRPDSSVVRASGICPEGPGFKPQSGHLF